jgi:hypothetical protein
MTVNREKVVMKMTRLKMIKRRTRREMQHLRRQHQAGRGAIKNFSMKSYKESTRE